MITKSLQKNPQARLSVLWGALCHKYWIYLEKLREQQLFAARWLSQKSLPPYSNTKGWRDGCVWNWAIWWWQPEPWACVSHMYLHDIFGTYLPREFVLQTVFQFLLSYGGSLKVGHEQILRKSSQSTTNFSYWQMLHAKKAAGLFCLKGAHSLCNIISIPSGNKARLGEHLNIISRIKRSNFQPAQRHKTWGRPKDTKGKKQVQFSLKLLSVKKAMNRSSKNYKLRRKQRGLGRIVEWSGTNAMWYVQRARTGTAAKWAGRTF